MEIERKFTLKSLPDNLESYPSHHIEQVYLNYNPVVRARKQDDEYYLTYKGSGMMAREGEYGWDGWLGMYFANFPKENMTILMGTQKKDAGTFAHTRKLRNMILSSL